MSAEYSLVVERIREIRERLEKATSGPWEPLDYDPNDHGDDNFAAIVACGPFVEERGSYQPQHKIEVVGVGDLYPEDGEQWQEAQANAAFIAAAREDVPWLLERIEEYAAILREARAGYEEFYESGNNARLLNVESRIRGLFPPLGVGSDGV